MRNFIKYLFLLAAMMITWQGLNAAGKDSGLVRLRDYISRKIELQIKDNEIRAKKGLPKNFIVFADEREMNRKFPGDEVKHVIMARQKNTTEETVKGLWNFEKNSQLQSLSEKLTEFAEKNKYEYYVVVAAIYNIDDDQTEATDFSKVTWQDIDGISDISPVRKTDETKALQYFTTKGQDKFNKLAGWIYNKVSPLKSNALYHFVITTYFPSLPDKADAMVGRVAHLQTIINADPTQNSSYNDAFVTYWQTQAQHKSATPWKTKEEWLLSASTGIQDFIATIRNFKESDLLAINTPITMLQHLKALEKPDVILSGLSFPTREHIIKVLNQLKELDDDYWLPKLTKGGENAMLAVVKSTPGKDADKLTDLLKKDSYQLLKDLNMKFDDAGIFGTNNNYTKFVQALTNVLISGLNDKKLNDIIENGRVFNLLVSSNDKKLVNYFSNDIEREYDNQVNTGSGTFKRKYSRANANLDDITKYWLNTYTETVTAEKMPELYNKAIQDATSVNGSIDLSQFDEKATPPESKILGPFDMMLVVPQKDFDINGFTLTKNDFQPIPMYYYYWLRKKHENEQWISLGEDAGNALLVVSMFTGIGELLEGGKLATQAIRAARILFDAKLLLNSTSEGKVDEWLKDKLGEGGFRIYQFIEYTYLIYATTKGGIVLANKVGPILTNAVTKLFELVVNTPELIASLRTTNYYSAFRTYFKNVLGRDIETIAQAGGSTGTVVANSIIPWQSFASRIRNSYPKIYDRFQEWGNSMKQEFTNQYNKLSKCLVAFDDNPAYLDVWEEWMYGYKVKIKTWADAVKEVDARIKPTIKKIKDLHPEIDEIGYRGSLYKGEKSDGRPFDTKDYDADAFIVSNELAEEFPRGITWRDAKQISREMKKLIEDLEDQLIHLEGIRFEPDKPFTFRVWTKAEYIREVKPNGCKLF